MAQFGGCDGLFGTVQTAWAALNGLIDDALAKVGANFYCGLLPGTSIDQFCTALNVTVVRTLDRGLYHPVLRLDFESGWILEVPERKLLAHERFMVCSYLLRAYADLYFKCAIPHLRDRRRAAWDFVELKMFGTMPQLMGHLGDIGSMERLHASDIPVSTVLGYLAKHRPGFSFSTWYSVFENKPRLEFTPPPVAGKPVRKIGSNSCDGDRLHRFIRKMQHDRLIDARKLTNSHFMALDAKGAEWYVVNSFAQDCMVGDQRVVSLMRTMICSNDCTTGPLFHPTCTPAGAFFH